MLWNQASIRAALLALPFAIKLQETPGEQYTSNGFSIELAGSEDTLHLQGFVTAPQGISAHDDVEVAMVELTNGYSEGGLTSNDPKMIDLYAAVRKLLAGMGAQIVPTLNDYF